jgi:hypothetical protein
MAVFTDINQFHMICHIPICALMAASGLSFMANTDGRSHCLCMNVQVPESN